MRERRKLAYAELIALHRLGVPWEVGLQTTTGERKLMLEATKMLDVNRPNGERQDV